MNTAALLYSEKLAQFDYGDDHPFKPMRARNAVDLCRRYGLLAGQGGLVEPTPLAPEGLKLFHDPDYLDALRRLSAGEPHTTAMLHYGLGTAECPVLHGIYEFCLLASGATKLGLDLVLSGEAQRAFNLVGGFHHAGPDHAEGFCYVNDVAIALAYARQRGYRVAFVDLDAHHCNGVQDAFYEDDRVLVISLHETGETLYPGGGLETEVGTGAGRGFNVNVPLLPYTDDEVYVSAFRQVVPPLLCAFAPDLVLAEVGADTLISDPLTHLRLTNNGYYQVVQDLCACAPRLVAVGGGGYDVFRTARCWALAWAALSGQDPQEDHAALVGGAMHGAETESLFDPRVVTRGEPKELALRQVEKVVRRLRETVFPILGAKSP